jgi:hypothetical protein
MKGLHLRYCVIIREWAKAISTATLATFCFIRTEGTILNKKLIFKLDKIRTPLTSKKHNFSLETLKLFSHEPPFHFFHIVSATSTADAYPVIVQFHLTIWRPNSTSNKMPEYTTPAAYICDLLKMTLKDSCIWHPVNFERRLEILPLTVM